MAVTIESAVQLAGSAGPPPSPNGDRLSGKKSTVCRPMSGPQTALLA